MNEQTFVERVLKAGEKAYIVGGWNRDTLMGRKPKDKDYCVTGFNKERFLHVFPTAKQVIGEKGKQTVDVFLLEIDGEVQEVALARKEQKTGEGYHGFTFLSGETITIEQDLYRRDLTINAIALDLSNGEYVDPFGGIADIRHGILRATSEAFYEDPLRVYRVAVRLAMTGFRVEPHTKEMMVKAAEEIQVIPKERVVQELKKALLATRPDLFFRLLAELEILSIHFQPVADLIGVKQPAAYHPEGDAFEHTMNVLVAMRDLTEDAHLMYAALVHDLGKGVTPKASLPQHHGHEDAGIPLVEELSKALGVPKKWKQAAVFATENHGKVHKLHQMREVKVVDLLTAAAKNPLGTSGLAKIGLADTRGKGDLTIEHPNLGLITCVSRAIQTVKGDKSLQGKKAWDDKRNRQAAIVKTVKKALATI